MLDNQKSINDLYAKFDTKYNALNKLYRERDALGTEAYIFDLKSEFDYRTTFVKRINQEIAKETKAQADFEAGSTDLAVS